MMSYDVWANLYGKDIAMLYDWIAELCSIAVRHSNLSVKCQRLTEREREREREMAKTQARATIEMDFIVSSRKAVEVVRLPVEILARQERSVLARIPGCHGLYDVSYVAYSMAYGPHYTAEPSSNQAYADFEKGTWMYFCPF